MTEDTVAALAAAHGVESVTMMDFMVPDQTLVQLLVFKAGEHQEERGLIWTLEPQVAIAHDLPESVLREVLSGMRAVIDDLERSLGVRFGDGG